MQLSGNELFYLILGVVAVALIVTMQFALKGYNSRLSAWAKKSGYDYEPARRVGKSGVTTWRATLDGRYDSAWFRRYSDFIPFSNNDNQQVYETLIRKRGDLEWRIFRFDTEAVGSHSVNRWRVWVCAVEGPWNSPALHICPTKLTDKVLAALGKRDIETGDREFDAAFHVSGNSEEFARSILTADLRKFLLEMGRYRWQVGGRFALLIWPGFSYNVKDIELMEFAMRRFVSLTSSTLSKTT